MATDVAIKIYFVQHSSTLAWRNIICRPGGRYWDYYPIFNSSNRDSFETQAIVDFIYGYPIFKWVTETSLHERVPWNRPQAWILDDIPNGKVHGANMGPTWGRQDPGGPHVGPMNLAFWDAPLTPHGQLLGFTAKTPSYYHNLPLHWDGFSLWPFKCTLGLAANAPGTPSQIHWISVSAH